MSSTITTQSVVNFAATHTELMPLAGVGGYTSEPALSLINDTLGEILANPFNWKWNRAVMNLMVTSQNRQDYLFAGATAFVLKGANVVGGVGIDRKAASTPGVVRSGSTVTVTTLDDHNFAVGDTVYLKGVADAGYDSTETITPSSSAWTNGYTILTVPTTKSFTFTIVGTPTSPSGASGVTDFGWIEYATMVDENEVGSPRYVRYLDGVRELRPNSRLDIPDKVSVYESGTAGVLSVRLARVPSASAFGLSLAYQKKAPIATDLTGTWAPVPDEFAFVVRQVFLAHAYRYVNSGRASEEYQKAQLAIRKALGRDDAEPSEEYVTPLNPIMGGIGFGW